MRKLTNARLVSKRLLDEWKLLASVFMGILIAVTISSGASAYLTALEQLAFRVSLNQISAPVLNLTVFASRVPLTASAIERVDELIGEISKSHIEDLYIGHEIYLRSASSLAGTEEAPLPAVGDQESLPTVQNGFFHSLSNLENHSVFIEGRAPNAGSQGTAKSPIVEAVISEQVADESKLGAGDSVVIVPDVFLPTRITARIVGVFQADDLTTEYWSTAAIILTSQSAEAQGGVEGGFPPPDGVVWDPNQELAIGLFVRQEVITEVVGPANPGTLTNPIVFGKIDKDKLAGWTASTFVERLGLIEGEIADTLPGSTVSSGTVRGLIAGVGRRVFFSKIPLLLLMTVMVVTVLFYMTMMVSYLAKSRERDSALMRTRGVGIVELLRLYTLEGTVMAGVAFVIGPFIAFGTVAILGLVPPFRSTTGGELLLVKIEPIAFFIAAAVAMLCLALYVAFGAAGTRSGLLVQKIRAARPATMSFFHRHYLDVGLVTIGSLVFWELQSREQIVTSGLFTELQVNETLLFGPILFLFVVALFFMRLFPLFVRYIGGESPSMAHLLTGVSVGGLVGGLLYFARSDGVLSEAYQPAAIVLAIGAAYYVTDRFRGKVWWWLGIAIQAALVVAYVVTEGIHPDDSLFVLTLGVLAIVPAQISYYLFCLMTRSAPVWLSISLWHMARNPLQYTWLVLLLVLVTGLGIFATTVGGTLTRSQEEQVRFAVPADIRVQGRPIFLSEGLQAMRERYVETPAFTHSALGYRSSGTIRNINMQVLALEPEKFAEIAWFRDDFADIPLEQIMHAIAVPNDEEKVTLPAGAQSIGLWLNPLQLQPLMSVWVVVQDSEGTVQTISLGEVGETEWHKVSSDLPDTLKGPLNLLAVSLYEPGTTTQSQGGGTPGTVLLDDIFVGFSDSPEHVVEGFENVNVWSPLPTNLIDSDVLYPTFEGAYSGARSAVFSFGPNKNRSVRGIYNTNGGGTIPIIISRGVAESTGLRPGMTDIVSISGWLVPVEVKAVIELFPTLDVANSGFMIADLDALSSYMNIMSQLSTIEANEMYLQKSGVSEDIVEEIAAELQSILLKVDDSTARLDEIRLDPLQNAGWRALVFMALVVVVLAAIFGYVAYMLLVGEKSKHELGFLQSLGLSRFQLLALLSFEHLTVVAMGLGVGTWAGFQMSRLMVAPLAVSNVGQSIVPPFILVTDWFLMVPTYGVILAIFVTVLLILNRSIGRTKLFELARGGDD